MSHKWNYLTCHNLLPHSSWLVCLTEIYSNGRFSRWIPKVHIQLSCKSSNKMFWWKPERQLDGPRVGEKDYNNQCNNKQHHMQRAHRGEKSQKAADDIDWRKVWGIFAVVSDCVLAVRIGLASSLRFDPLLQNTQDTAAPDMSAFRMFPQLGSFSNTWITFSCVLKPCLFLNSPWWWTNSVLSLSGVRRPLLEEFVGVSFFLLVYTLFILNTLQTEYAVRKKTQNSKLCSMEEHSLTATILIVNKTTLVKKHRELIIHCVYTAACKV